MARTTSSNRPSPTKLAGSAGGAGSSRPRAAHPRSPSRPRRCDFSAAAGAGGSGPGPSEPRALSPSRSPFALRLPSLPWSSHPEARRPLLPPSASVAPPPLEEDDDDYVPTPQTYGGYEGEAGDLTVTEWVQTERGTLPVDGSAPLGGPPPELGQARRLLAELMRVTTINRGGDPERRNNVPPPAAVAAVGAPPAPPPPQASSGAIIPALLPAAAAQPLPLSNALSAPPPPPPAPPAQEEAAVPQMSLFAGLAPVAAPLWPHLLLALVGQLGGACVFLATPRAFGRVLDAVAPSAAANSLLPALLQLGILYAGQCVAAFMQAWLLASATERLALRLRTVTFEAIMRQDIAFFDSTQPGELLSRLGADVAQVTTAVGASARGVRAVLEAAGALFVLSLTSPQLTCVALLVAPVALLLSQRLGGRVKALSRSAAEALAEGSGVAEEAVANIRTLKSYVAEGAALRRYAARCETTFELQQGIALQSGLLDGLTRAAGNMGAITILALGGTLVAAGSLTVGALTSFVIYTLYISSALGNLSGCYAELKRAEGTGGRLFSLLRLQPSVTAAGQASATAEADEDDLEEYGDVAWPGLKDEPAPRKGSVHLELQNVSFRFPSRGGQVLRDCSINIQPGKVTALVGPSGGGKSTVAALLQRFYDPEAGRVLLNGQDVRTMDPSVLRLSVAAVSQEPHLFDASVADNIALGAQPGREVTRAQVEDAARAANAHDFITALPGGYDALLGERGTGLSGGQRQRIAIARAILKDAPVLLLDEATSSLDVTSEGLVQQALERLTAGRTTLVIAHRFAALKGADAIYVMDGGRVVERGSHEQLVQAGGLYSRMYRLGKFAGPQAGLRSLAEWATRVPTLAAAAVASRLPGRPPAEKAKAPA